MRSAISRSRLPALGLAVLLLLAAASEPAMARRGHSGSRHHHGSRAAVGLILAVPMYRYFPAPASAGPLLSAPVAPTLYIEREDAGAAAQSGGNWWYYCADSAAYYPHVAECASAWQRIAAQPAPGR